MRCHLFDIGRKDGSPKTERVEYAESGLSSAVFMTREVDFMNSIELVSNKATDLRLTSLRSPLRSYWESFPR